jgi:signal transduction histidine kinase
MVLLPMLVIGYISYHSEKEAITNQLKQMMVVSVDSLALAVEDIIKEVLRDVSFFTGNPILFDGNWSAEEIEERFDYFLKKHQMYREIIFLNPSGVVIADRHSPSIKGSNLSDRLWYKEVMAGKEVVFSDILRLPITDEPLLAIGAAVKDENGNLAGIISPSVDLMYLYRRIENFANVQQKLGLNGYAFLVNGQGEILAHPDQTKILAENYFAASGLSSEKLKELCYTAELFYQKKDNSINVAAPINRVAGFENDWHVIVSVPAAEMYASLNKLLAKYLMLFGIILLVIIILAVKLTQNILAPINTLITSSADIVTGKKVELKHPAIYKEIKILNDAFNLMVEKLREREQEQIRGERLKIVGQLAAGFVHEIRNPLATIRGFIQLIESNSQKGSREKQYCPIIIKEIDRVNGILGDLLTLAKSSAISNFTLTDLNSIVEELVLLYQPQGDAAGISLIPELGSLPAVCSEPNHLKQVFINFIKNAFEAMDNTGGSLTITTAFLEEEQAVKIQFADTGCGMDKETLDKIGTPFFTTKESGTGLGLLTSYRIIKDLEGTLFIDSELGKGSVFTLKFPVELSYGNSNSTSDAAD